MKNCLIGSRTYLLDFIPARAIVMVLHDINIKLLGEMFLTEKFNHGVYFQTTLKIVILFLSIYQKSFKHQNF